MSLIVKVVVSKNLYLYFLFVQVIRYCSVPDVSINKCSNLLAILENKGGFENIRKYNIRKYKTFGKTIKKKLYVSDEKERCFHILYYSDQKACAEHEQIEAKIDRMTRYLDGLKGEKATVGEGDCGACSKRKKF